MSRRRPKRRKEDESSPEPNQSKFLEPSLPKPRSSRPTVTSPKVSASQDIDVSTISALNKSPKQSASQSLTQNGNQRNPDEPDRDLNEYQQGEELYIPDDPLQEFTLPSNFFVPKQDKNLGVGKLGEPRLIIHHITNENFKSYAGIVILGPFHQNFTSIIGPNGSGKSNVIDSMLFVFGFSSKKIRLQNLPGLIHNSDAVKGKRPTSATVTIHFQTIIDDINFPGEKFTTVPNSQFTISRTCFKDGGSVYKVDSKKAKQKDVKNRLKAEGIDLDHNRFLILQGEVEQISLMKPKAVKEHDEGMLEYLEDIIGTERYKEPIDKLKIHTETLSNLRSDKLERVAALEKQVDALRGARNEAAEYLRQINEVTIIKHKKCQLDLQQSLHDLKINSEKYEEQKEIYHKMQEGQQADKTQLKDAEKQAKSATKAFDKVEKLLADIQNKQKSLAKEEQEITFENNSSKKTLEKNEKEISSLNKKLKKLETEPEKLKEKIESLEEEKIELKNDEEEAIKNYTAKTSELAAKTDEIKNERAEYEKVQLEQKEIVNKVTREMKKYQEELKLITKNFDSIKGSYDKAINDMEKLRNEQNSQQNTESLEENIQNLDIELKELTNDVQEINKEIANKNFNHQIDQLDYKLKEKMEALELHNSSQNNLSGNRLTDFFNKMMQEGQLRGGEFYGRLGDLGAIDKEYDVAISTAAGALDKYVVDNTETAESCINLLKGRGLISIFYDLFCNYFKYNKRAIHPLRTSRSHLSHSNSSSLYNSLLFTRHIKLI